ncbi:MAG: alpha/beta hydrolase [Thermomicrobiales bacterium]
MPDDFKGAIIIGARRLYVEAAGTGSPTVVLEAGLLGRSDVWSRDLQQPKGERDMVFPAVAKFTHVCTYDRPGTVGEVNPDLEPYGPLFYPSRSDPVPMPRTVAGMAEDLASVLEASGQPGPYVLVGHSVGGLVVRYFAMTRPDDVAGMVLVDATTEDVWDSFRERLSPDDWAVFERLTVENPEMKAAYPDAEFLWTSPLADDRSVAQLRKVREETPLKPMPLFVLSHGIPFQAPFPGWPTEQMEQSMSARQAWLTKLVPDGKHKVAELSGHNIHQDQPELVIEAIRMVVDAIRDPSTWTR